MGYKTNTSMAVTNSKRLVAAFLQFMDNEMQKSEFSTEDKQGMEVACQCLQAAYTVTATDVPMSQKSLEEIFLAACPQTEEKMEVSEEDKQKAEQFKMEGNSLMTPSSLTTRPSKSTPRTLFSTATGLQHKLAR